MNKNVIYTAAFAHKNNIDYMLFDPEIIPEGFDFVIFTDNTKFKSKIWDVRPAINLYTDGARNAKKYKLLPHRYLKEYEISIWIDADIKLIKDPTVLIHKYLNNNNLAILDHTLCGRTVTGNMNVRDCIYDEARFIQMMGDINPKHQYKDNMDIINSQIQRYRNDNYPEHNGLGRTTVILRKHNEPDVITHSENWWLEMKYGSKRDQLSFNYVAWKYNLNFSYIQEDIDDNEYFLYMKKWRHTR